MKRFTILFIAALMLALLAGCGETDVNEPVSEEKEVTEEVATPTPTAEPTEIVEEASAEEPEEEQSPFALWDYEGYVDECAEYLWADEFADRDFDGDGKNDKLARKCDSNAQLAFYTIEFGDGTTLEIPQGWNTGFPHIESADLDGDDDLELLFTLSYDTSTDPLMFGDMWLFDKEGTSYKEVKLPLDEGENGAKTITITYGEPEGDYITISAKDYDFEVEVELGADWIADWWVDNITEEDHMVGAAKIKEHNGQNTVYCEVEPFGKTGKVIGFWLASDNGEYKVLDMGFSDFSHAFEE